MSTETLIVPATPDSQGLIGYLLWELPTRIESLALIITVTIVLTVVILILLQGPRARTGRAADRRTQYSRRGVHVGTLNDFRSRYARSNP